MHQECSQPDFVDKSLKQGDEFCSIYKGTSSAPAVNMLTRYFTEAVPKYAQDEYTQHVCLSTRT